MLHGEDPHAALADAPRTCSRAFCTLLKNRKNSFVATLLTNLIDLVDLVIWGEFGARFSELRYCRTFTIEVAAGSKAKYLNS